MGSVALIVHSGGHLSVGKVWTTRLHFTKQPSPVGRGCILRRAQSGLSQPGLVGHHLGCRPSLSRPVACDGISRWRWGNPAPDSAGNFATCLTRPSLISAPAGSVAPRPESGRPAHFNSFSISSFAHPRLREHGGEELGRTLRLVLTGEAAGNTSGPLRSSPAGRPPARLADVLNAQVAEHPGDGLAPRKYPLERLSPCRVLAVGCLPGLTDEHRGAADLMVTDVDCVRLVRRSTESAASLPTLLSARGGANPTSPPGFGSSISKRYVQEADAAVLKRRPVVSPIAV